MRLFAALSEQVHEARVESTLQQTEDQAELVRRMYREYLEGDGLKRIAVRFNNERVPPPSAGRRGTGSWCPGAIREMLRNARYRGVYSHGKTLHVRRGGKRVAYRAAAEDILTVDIPESVFLPEGLEFTEGLSSDGSRRVWAISMTAHPVRSIFRGDPTVASVKMVYERASSCG